MFDYILLKLLLKYLTYQHTIKKKLFDQVEL